MADKNRGPTKLTDKQEKFVLAVVEGMTQADAYRLAYNTSKMTDKSIHEKASALMANVKVRSRYEELRGKVVESAEKKSILTVERVLQEISDLLETNITDVANIIVKEVIVRDEEGKIMLNEDGDPITETQQHIHIKDTDEMSVAALKSISEIGYNRYGIYVKRYDKQKTVEMAAKHLGMFIDKVEHSGKIDINEKSKLIDKYLGGDDD